MWGGGDGYGCNSAWHGGGEGGRVGEGVVGDGVQGCCCGCQRAGRCGDESEYGARDGYDSDGDSGNDGEKGGSGGQEWSRGKCEGKKKGWVFACVAGVSFWPFFFFFDIWYSHVLLQEGGAK